MAKWDMPLSALAKLRELIATRAAAAKAAPEQPLRMGVYRGYAGENPTSVVYYHGGTYEPGSELTSPLYMTRDPEAARSYAVERGASVVKLQPRFQRIAPESELRALAAKYVPENESAGYTPASALDESLHGERDVNRLVNALQRTPLFYEAARAGDLSMVGVPLEALVALPGRGAQVPAASSERVFATPQRRIADYYARKRAEQLGAEPHVEMLLVDPFAGQAYGHAIPVDPKTREINYTRARKLKPEDVKERTQLYRKGGAVRGGLNQIKECSCHG